MKTTRTDPDPADPETKAPSLLQEPMKMAQDSASFEGSFSQPCSKQSMVLDVLSNIDMFSAVGLENGPSLHVEQTTTKMSSSKRKMSNSYRNTYDQDSSTIFSAHLSSPAEIDEDQATQLDTLGFKESDPDEDFCDHDLEKEKQHISYSYSRRVSMSGALQESKTMFEKIKTEEEEELIDTEIKEECIETEIMAETFDAHKVSRGVSFDESSDLESQHQRSGHLHRVGLSYKTHNVVSAEQVAYKDRNPIIRWRISVLPRSKKDVPQQQDIKEEDLTDQHLCDQERISALDYVEPESFHIKEDEDEIPISREEKQLVLKQEADTLTLTLDNWESCQIKAELGVDHQLLSHCSSVVENQHRTGSKDEKNVFKTEEDMDYHQGVSDITWQPKIQLHRIELPQLPVSEEEDVHSDQQLCQHHENQNHQKISISQSLSLKDRTIVLTSHHEESDYMDTETDSEQQLLSPVAERQDQTEISLRDSGSLSETQMTHPSNLDNGFNTHTETQSKTQTTKKSLICDVCNKSFTAKSRLVRHMRTHTGEKPYVCNVCNKSFRQKSHLVLHMGTHTDEKPFICNVCNKSFTVKSYLVVHMKTHTGEKPYVCNVCSKSFRSRSHLLDHMKTHSGEKPYVCNTCNQSFKRKNVLVDHMRTHTGERPYVCNVCNNSFRSRSHFVFHMRTHTGEKPYVCNVCNNSFKSGSHLLDHMITHTGEKPFSCKNCGKGFSRKSTFNRHMSTHTDEKPYVCDICNKAFRSSPNLVVHMRTHTGEKPYICNICNNAFRTSSHLVRHMKCHTESKQ